MSVWSMCVCMGYVCLYGVCVSVWSMCVCMEYVCLYGPMGYVCLYGVCVSVWSMCVCMEYVCLYGVCVSQWQLVRELGHLDEGRGWSAAWTKRTGTPNQQVFL